MSDYSAIRVQLEEKLRQLTARVEEIDEDLREPGDDDWEERAVELENAEVLSKVGNLSIQELSQIRHALQQIELGRYGRCERCGDTIRLERLEALPFATTCIRCA
jgi:RNA polymerase-binding transcription factor DksA